MIRSLIYLDEPKLLSLSSQVLEGLTEYLLTEKSSSDERTEKQKGPIASGRELADAIRSTETSVERRVLHDHAFSVFERKLIETDTLLDIPTAMEETETIAKVAASSFIRVQGRATFIDAAKLTTLLKVFNSLGESITYVTKNEEIQSLVKAIEDLKSSTNDKNKLAQLNKQLKQATDPGLLARASGLYQDPKFLEHLGILTQFGFSDQLEIHQKVDGILYTACLKRECLREAEDLVIRKYSRKTEKQLTVLGLITQTASDSKAEQPNADFQPGNMKEALTNMIDHIALMETSLSGKSSKEVIVDPIAVYVSL